MRSVLQKWTSLIVAIAVAVSVWIPLGANEAHAAYAPKLFLSQYTEGSSFNKAIEIYNGTNAAANLSEYKVLVYYNGSSSAGGEITLTGSLASGSTYVIAHSSANAAIMAKANLLSGSLQHNGNDAIVLEHNGTAIDIIGTIGSSSNFASNTTLFRKSSVTSGSTTYQSSQWTTRPDDSADGFGQHTMDGFGSLSDADSVAADKSALEVGYGAGDSASNVTQNITLALNGTNGTSIAWSSSLPAVIAANGTVTRPSAAAGDQAVTLTATISKGSASQTKSFQLTVKAVAGGPAVSTIASAKSKAGSKVTVQGIVTVDRNALSHNNNMSLYIQDSTAGINIYANSASIIPNLKEGDDVKVTGTIEIYHGLTEIVPASSDDIQVISKNNPVPAPAAASLAQLIDPATAEPLEGELVRFNAYLFQIPSSPAGGGYNATILDENYNSMTLRIMSGTGIQGKVQAGKWYEVTGILGEYDTYQVLPRKQADLKLLDPQPAKPDGSKQSYEAIVTKVVDGDTIHLDRNILGTNKVRFLSIDTPETNYEGQSQGHYADLASTRLAELLPVGTKVRIEPGTEAVDGYGRLLAHVFKGEQDINKQLLLEGMAVNYYIWPNMGHFEEYSAATREAIKNGRGMFNPSNPIEMLPYEFRFTTRGAPDKYVGHYYTKEYVDPDKWELIPTEYRVFFFTEADAQEAGYVKVETPTPYDPDKQAPVTYYSIQPVSNGRYIYGLVITLDPTDDDAGVDSTKYRINEQGWSKYTGSFMVTAAGTLTVEYYSEDKSGNVEQTNKMDFTKGTCDCARR